MKSLLAVFLFGTLVAVTMGSKCDDMERIKVMTQWRQVYSEGQDRIDFGQAVYRTFFKINPESVKMFHHVKGEDVTSGEFVAHTMRVLNGLQILITLLDQPEAYHAAVEHLHKQHQSRPVAAGHFEDFRKALHHVIPAQLGKCYDHEAWDDCLGLIGHDILRGPE